MNDSITLTVQRGDGYNISDRFDVKVALEEHQDAKGLFADMREAVLRLEESLRKS